MFADQRFINQSNEFWAHVRLLSEARGYTSRRRRKNKVVVKPSAIRGITLDEILSTLQSLGHDTDHIYQNGKWTPMARLLESYFNHRADVLNNIVQHNLMDSSEAKVLYEKVKADYSHLQPLAPLNKQKNEKKTIAYLTAIVNTLIQANIGDYSCDYDPRGLAAVTQNKKPLRALSRRLDGAFPARINPIAVWEIKEYYHTTTFGSRVADGVYETLLDGMEISELSKNEGIDILHYLIIDSHYTWWVCGCSYLCRVIDMLHMGYVNAVIFGKEVISELPNLVKDWVKVADSKEAVLQTA